MNVDISLNRTLTALVGENNAGKSNIVDALRLVTTPNDGRRSRYFSATDISRSATEDECQLEAYYEDVSAAQEGDYINARSAPTSSSIVLGVKYTSPLPGERFGKTEVTAGPLRATDQPVPGRQKIRHVYLPPLRDAKKVLSSEHGERIAFILRNLQDDDTKIAAFEKKAKTTFDNLEKDPTISGARAAIQRPLNRLTEGVDPQSVGLGFADPDLLRLAKALRFKLSHVNIDPTDLADSGLGYANLLFMATVLIELAAAKDADLTLLLVEEPEAHLHPQLQALMLSFLQEQAKLAGRSTIGRYEGAVQIIVSTHSPNLTAALRLENIVVVRPKGNPRAQGSARQTVVIPVEKLELKARFLNKISRYLDVTRSSLVFGGSVILIEGIAEALLLPVFARVHIPNDDAGRERRSRFVASALAPIDGVDFEPYVRLLLTKYKGTSIADRVTIVTDEDPTAPGNRATSLRELARQLGAANQLEVFVGRPTLEPELLKASFGCMKAAFLEVHPRSADDWLSKVERIPKPEQGAALASLMKEKRTPKGDLAQAYAEEFMRSDDVSIPPYLAHAIDFASKASDSGNR